MIFFNQRKIEIIHLQTEEMLLTSLFLEVSKKFFVNLLSQNTSETSKHSNSSCLEVKLHISEQAKQIGLMDLKSPDVSLIEFEEFICWLGFVKDTKKVRKMFNSENLAINLMEAVLWNYSHHKLHRALENEAIKPLFSYFIRHGEIQFMNNIGLIGTPNNVIGVNLQK